MIESWFVRNQRRLPWRDGYDPYRVWVSEVMLQQTRVEVVLGYFARFIERFPTVRALAAASEEEVMAAWSGLGYYRRARMLHEGARAVVKRFRGRVPSDLDNLRSLPGIGRYTAGAIASVAFNERAPIVDGNVARVLARLFGSEEHPWARAEELVAACKNPRNFNQGLMELGALICTPRKPSCLHCPLRADCVTRGDALPRVKKKKPPRAMRIALYLITDRRGRVLMRRESGRLMNAMYHLPHGDTSLLSGRPLDVDAGELLGTFRHTVTTRRIEFALYAAVTRRRVRAADYIWIDPMTIAEVPHPSYVKKALGIALLWTAAAQPPQSIVIRARAMLDVRAGTVREHPVIVVRGDRIESVSFGKKKAPRGATVIDLGDAVLLPGLIDAHVHLAWAPGPQDELAVPGVSKQAADDARTTLLAGFTTVRDLGSTGGADLLLRDAIANGRLTGPRILAAGPGLGAPGGACDQVFGGEATASDEAGFLRRVDEVIAAGADVVKVCTGGGVVPTNPKPRNDVPAAQVRAIADAARKHGRKLAAHAQGPDAINAAIAGGAASIEHGGFIDATLAKKMRENNVWLVPTLHRLDVVAERNPAVRAARDAMFEKFTDAWKAGVPVAFGTDATVIPHGTNAREFATLVRLGMPAIEALRAATTNAAALLGISDIGDLAAGKRADIIAVPGDPLRDVAVMERVSFVMKGGVVVKK